MEKYQSVKKIFVCSAGIQDNGHLLDCSVLKYSYSQDFVTDVHHLCFIEILADYTPCIKILLQGNKNDKVFLLSDPIISEIFVI